MDINGFFGRNTKPLARSWWLGNTAIQYYCAACGAEAGIMFILAFIIAGFIPPPKPTWDAETISHCRGFPFNMQFLALAKTFQTTRTASFAFVLEVLSS